LRTQREKGVAFRDLHAGEPFVIPNPWDGGSARVLEALGFQALATTSSGFAFTLGRLDGTVTLDEIEAHVRLLAEVCDLPVSVDLENGYGAAPEAAAEAIRRVAAAGAVGGSIEDWDREEERFYALDEARERVSAAAEAAHALPFPFLLTARAENLIHGVDDLDDTIERLRAFEAAGADVLFAPGLRTPEQIRTVRDAVSKPLNVLAFPGMNVRELAEAGAQRISVGGGMTWAAAGALAAAAQEVLEQGTFGALESSRDVRGWLS
jgi:2-methylisocitrate lyase-like PEP mutase family enzyme